MVPGESSGNVLRTPRIGLRRGQETSLRAIAGCVGPSVLVEHTATRLRRGDLSIGMPGASVARVEATLGFALSQRNNYAISALVFLISVLGP